MKDDELDPVFKALASGARRRVLDLLREGPLTTGDLCAAFPELSRFAVMQHVGVLESAGLLTPERRGRHRYNHLNPVPLQRVYERWVSRYAGHWSQALVALKSALESASLPPDDRAAALFHKDSDE